MKIRALTEENRSRLYAMLSLAFPKSGYETRLVQLLHENAKPIHEWVCIHTNRIIAYVAFTNAYRKSGESGEGGGGREVCGLHLAPMAVTPEFQNQGVGSELLRYALRQVEIKDRTIFVLGEPDYYRRFGFKQCREPVCPYDTNNTHFLSLRNEITEPFMVGYEPEFKAAEKGPKLVKSTKSSPPSKSARQNSSKRSPKGKGKSKGRGSF